VEIQHPSPAGEGKAPILVHVRGRCFLGCGVVGGESMMQSQLDDLFPAESPLQYGNRAISWLQTLPDEVRHWAHSRLLDGHTLAELKGLVDEWRKLGGF